MGKAAIISGGDRGAYTVNLNYSDGSTVKRSAWCADLTEDLSGTVATAEVPGDTRGVNILPGYRLVKSNYIESRNGLMTYSKDMTPVGAVFAAMILPGWQKYYPTYRYGTLVYVSYETDWCNVLLDVVYSEEQDEILPINQTSYLANVPIEYMECNSGAFTVGDKVLVEFQDQDWDQPVVIGFKEQPKGCGWEPWSGPAEKYHYWVLELHSTLGVTTLDPFTGYSASGNGCTAVIDSNAIALTANNFIYLYTEDEVVLSELAEKKVVLKVDAIDTGTFDNVYIQMKFGTTTRYWYLENGETGIFEYEMPTDLGNLVFFAIFVGEAGSLTLDYIEME